MNRLDLISYISWGILFIMVMLGGHIPLFYMINTFTFSTLSIIGFFIGFIKFDSDSKLLSFMFYKIYGFGLAIGFITIMFTIQHWPIPITIMTILSIIMILISLILGLRESMSENKNKIEWKYYIRIFMAIIPLIYLIIKYKI